MPTLFIDGDACPVKDEAIRVATRYKLDIILVANQGMRPIPGVRQVVVGPQFDAADDWIVEHTAPLDVTVTNDIQLAGRCLAKGGKALSPTGHIFTQQNIGAALATRELNAHLRQTGEISGHNPSFSKKDRSKFLQSLDTLIYKSLNP
jgi:hypothetical protein